MRKVLIAIDSFKGSLSSSAAAAAIEKGLKKVSENVEVQKVPLADGGEGTVESIVEYAKGEYVTVTVNDPLMRNISAIYGLTDNGEKAIIEMAAASGIGLLSKEEYNPLVATTFGTGELIKDALNKGCREIILGIGGSITNDAGIGMASALGVKFLDCDGNEIGYAPKDFNKLHSIDFSTIDSRVFNTIITVLCDVNNPLLGENGASHVYGPQKGATPEMVKLLDRQLSHIADIAEEKLTRDFRNIPGAGAAGGMGFGTMAFLQAKLVGGINFLCDFVGLEKKIADADLVITGEGKVDFQTRFNKLPVGISDLARKHNKRTICFAGVFDESALLMKGDQFDDMFSIMEEGVTSEEAINKAALYLENIASRELKKYLTD